MTKTCFVIQGFGKKTDYEQGKQFDLDASYEVIKEAIEKAGLQCNRADELGAGGVIDQIMYEQLLSADLVVADISTLNFNAAYELGVRLALRPYATLIVGEKGLNFPFDINHIQVHTYEHLGSDIGYKEVKRFMALLTNLAKEIIANTKNDSPVYTYLRNLPENGFLEFVERLRKTEKKFDAASSSLRTMKEQAKKAMDEDRFGEAKDLWKEVRNLAGKDDYVVQQLALATYKSKLPDEETALCVAAEILEYLQPHNSFDPETLGLWASVHKRLYERTGKAQNLEEALFALERGYFIKGDYYNGINLAFMLNTKASGSGPDMKQELIGVSRYVRRKVIDNCLKELTNPDLSKNDQYWIMATMYEAYVGLGDDARASEWKAKMEGASTVDWMKKSTEEQVNKLRKLLEQSR